MFRRSLAVSAVAASVAEVAADVPGMPQEYTAVLQFKMPYIPLEMPIRVLTSSTQQKVEYYNGLEQDWSDETGSYKYSYNNSQRVCVYSPASAGPTSLMSGLASSWSAMQFFPNLTQYNRSGEELVGGIMCDKYVLSATHGKTGTMDDHISFYWDPVLNMPVRWHIHARHPTFGSHTDEYIFDVMSLQAGPPADSAFLKPEMCKKPQEGKISLPMKHFLHAAHGLAKLDLSSSTDLAFETYLKQHGRNYVGAELNARRTIFESNVKMIRDLNNKHGGQTQFKGNKFLDMTKEEVMSFRGGKSGRSSRRERRSEEDLKLVSTFEHEGLLEVKDFDWRVARPGVVSPVKDQAMCGSCWTYGLTEPIESIQAIQTGKLTQLPEQFVLDCTWAQSNDSLSTNAGCDGGNSDTGAFEIIRKYGGVVPTAESYGSYLSVNGFCKDIKSMDVGAKIVGWTDIKDKDEQGLLAALLKNGPISVGIQVPDEMLFYDSGVLQVDSCKQNEDQIDHAVTLTGFGEENGVPYYTIRNSWSTYWGDNGYIKIARGVNDCCVSCQAGFPTVAATEEALIV
eukprot:CAMPEP_0206454528 /NCGR_PEP_ID=MMETSP0324_2-20121206/21191_1 /ASSEMBLY_ACC=CAM_ASM_000836 /TAXON_ID=2866 /ORGANISM="Crypthecodinium cohnii, Strain Seligo" /LENGTH=565 /DNA_ID=CAMNT_0053925019 /DNA_START=49 /DNA_END=1746 /DNA_ORIENTATION=+